MELNVELQACISDFENAFTNYIEISSFESDDPDYQDPEDVDSMEDNNPDNDTGGTPDDPNEDDVVTGDKYDGEDEDDHDPERVEVFDLALIKEVVTESPYKYGDVLEFSITIRNQGNVAGQDVQVVDYLPVGYSFASDSNTGWTDLGSNMLSYTVPGSIAVDGEISISLFLTLEMTTGGADNYTNVSEIKESGSVTGNMVDCR